MQRLEIENYNTKEYYNNVLISRFDSSGFDYGDEQRVDMLLSKFYGGKLLDVGCGVSPLCVKASRVENSEVWGLDFADQFIEKAKAKYPQIHYMVGDFNRLPFEDGFFDYVVLGEVIEHSETPQAIIQESFRVLKTGGRLALSTPLDEKKEMHQYAQHIWSFRVEDLVQMIGKEKIVSMTPWSNNIVCHAKK